jgi:hypothetical protein
VGLYWVRGSWTWADTGELSPQRHRGTEGTGGADRNLGIQALTIIFQFLDKIFGINDLRFLLAFQSIGTKELTRKILY